MWEEGKGREGIDVVCCVTCGCVGWIGGFWFRWGCRLDCEAWMDVYLGEWVGCKELLDVRLW